MAEAFLVPLIEKLTELLAEEAKSLKGVHEEVESLKDELEIIQPLLNDAEDKSEKGETSEAVKAWVRQLRAQADRIEDLITAYRYRLRQVRGEKGLAGYVRRASRFVQSLKPRREIASEIWSIKRSLHEIKGRGEGYGLRPLTAGSEQHVVDPRLESLFLNEDELVGIEEAKDELVAEVVKGPPECLVISLVGQGGVGKTTLAKKVFDDGDVKWGFESASAWVTVSQTYDPKNVLKTLNVKMCGGEEADQTVEGLIGRLRNYLQAKRYVIVFDDVWEEKFWDDIKLALPCNNEGSRIIITTRNGSIANYCKKSPYDLVRHVKPWSPSSALELFCKKAFRYEFRGICPEELLELSMEIVGKCQGLPLVVAAIAGLLATKEKTVSEWKKVLRDLNSKVEINSELTRVHKILSLSYHDIPHSLRPCFMYICLFPEDYSIPDERLYRLWIAEGFVKAKGNKTLEEVAEEYMSELVKRNLVLIHQWGIGEGNCLRVHDLMRDVILSKAEELFFCQIWEGKISKFRGNGRRLIISGEAKTALEKAENSRARSLLLFNTNDDQLTKSFTAALFEKFKTLEVLDVESSPIDTLPKELGKMICLKYLSLRKTNVKTLPKSISKLRNLYSLDIRDTLITALPKEINKLTNLQHILAYRYNPYFTTSFDYVIGVRLQKGFRDLKDLQTLTAVEAHLGGVALVRELEKLERLRWLDVTGLTAELSTALCTTIGKMNHLQRLCLSSVNETEPLSLQHISSPPLHLRDLVLVGRLERLPVWISELHSLCGLSLASSRLSDGESIIKSLKALPNLETLEIGRDAYEGEELRFEEGSFSRLKTLEMDRLGNLRAVKIDRGALPVLEQLRIAGCPRLGKVSVEHLKNINYATANGNRLI